jgi:hypothetical protein
MEKPEKSPSRNWRFVSWLCILAFVSLGIWWMVYLPTVGKGGLFLAIGATLMPLFWEKIGTVARMSWIAMLFLLLAVEYRAIDKDRADFVRDEASRRKEENQKFSDIGESITTNVQKLLDHSELEFAATMARSDRILNGVNDTVKTETGGDSYLWYEPRVTAIGEDALEGYKNTVILTAFPRVIGHYSLPVVHVEVFGGPYGWIIGGGSSTPGLEYQLFSPKELARSRQSLSIKYAQENNAKELFHVSINAPNGSYEEQILVEKFGENWEFGARLFKAGNTKPLRMSASLGFPKGMLRPKATW